MRPHGPQGLTIEEMGYALGYYDPPRSDQVQLGTSTGSTPGEFVDGKWMPADEPDDQNARLESRRWLDELREKSRRETELLAVPILTMLPAPEVRVPVPAVSPQTASRPPVDPAPRTTSVLAPIGSALLGAARSLLAVVAGIAGMVLFGMLVIAGCVLTLGAVGLLLRLLV